MRAFAVVLLLGSACATHVTVAAHPAATAPQSEREAYRAEFRDDVYTLNDGERVEDPADLLPALDANSTTAVMLKNASFDLALAHSLMIGGGVGIGAGFAVMLGGFVVDNGEQNGAGRNAAIVGALTGLVGVAVEIAGLYGPLNWSQAETDRASKTWHDDLAATLALDDAAPATPAHPTTTQLEAGTASASPSPTPTPSPATPTFTTTAQSEAGTPRGSSPAPAHTPNAQVEAGTDALPLHVVVHATGKVVATLEAGPDGALAPGVVDEAARPQVADLAGILATRGSVLFACFARSFPAAGAKHTAKVHVTMRGDHLDVAPKPRGHTLDECAAGAFARGGIMSGGFDFDLEITHTAGHFVAPKCRRALGSTDAVAASLSCTGLFIAPEGFEVTMVGAAIGEDTRLRILAEAFREDGCAKKDFAICKRRSDDAVAPVQLLADLRAMEDRYVRTLTDDDAIIAAALAMIRP